VSLDTQVYDTIIITGITQSTGTDRLDSVRNQTLSCSFVYW